jgi:pimeloyl-ACP methyl ester carboxylesterase
MKDVPLLLVHGYPFDRTMWYSTIAALGAAAKVLAPDLPGFGRSAVPSEQEPSMEFMADFLAQFLDANDAEAAIVAGMSMGGYVALAFAEKYPERLRGLGLISSQAAADSEEARAARSAAIQKIRSDGPVAGTEGVVEKLFSNQTRNPDIRNVPVEAARRAGIEGLCWAQEAMGARPDRTAFLSSLSIPVLIVHGMDDKIVPCARARLLAETLRKPILVELRGVGHASPLEAPDQVATGLARLVRQCRDEAEKLAPSPKIAAQTEPESSPFPAE